MVKLLTDLYKITVYSASRERLLTFMFLEL